MATPGKITEHGKPTIVIVGRANVGKSTLFNKLIEEHKALVSTIAGTTRTVNEGDILWRGHLTHIIDTGGPDSDENEPLAQEIDAQTKSALEQADMVLFVVDAKIGVLPQEYRLADRVRKLTKGKFLPVILVANKCDTQKITANTNDAEWSRLRFGQPMPISAVNGRGVGDLLDAIYAALEKLGVKPTAHQPKPDAIKVALIGKPNVGKSSLFNKLIGEEKVIVSPIAHTTREPYDTTVSYELDNETHKITFVDTAGIRRKAKVSGELEREGVSASIARLERSDIILLVLDTNEPLSSQDLQLGALCESHSKSVIIVITKWDKTDDASDAHRQEVKKRVYASFPHLDFAPIIFTSGSTGYRVHQIFPQLIEVYKARQTIVAPAELEGFLKNLVRQHRPARGKGTRHPEILGLRQVNAGPPVFEIFIKRRTSLHRSYLNFMEKALREQFSFIGTPIVIKMTKMKR